MIFKCLPLLACNSTGGAGAQPTFDPFASRISGVSNLASPNQASPSQMGRAKYLKI